MEVLSHSFVLPQTVFYRVDRFIVHQLYSSEGAGMGERTLIPHFSCPSQGIFPFRSLSLLPGEAEWSKTWWDLEEHLARVVPFSLFHLWDLFACKESALIGQLESLVVKTLHLLFIQRWEHLLNSKGSESGNSLLLHVLQRPSFGPHLPLSLSISIQNSGKENRVVI